MSRLETGGRWRVHAAWLVVLVVGVLATWWATSQLLPPKESSPSGSLQVATHVAAVGEVAETTSLTADVVFQPGPSGVAGAAGTLTSVVLDPARAVSAGDVLVTIDLRPVVVAAGEVPVFRDLHEGLSGPDVAQLRALVGVTEGEEFDATVQEAVIEWQESLGVEADGIVRRGDVVFLAQLPTRAHVADGVQLGGEVGPGQVLVHTVQDRASVTVTDRAGGQLREGLLAEILVPDQDPVGARLGQPSLAQDGNAQFPLLDTNGDPACTLSCGLAFPVPGPGQVQVTVEIVTPATGVVVPDSAVATQPDGSTVVLAVDGAPIPVQVVTTASGMSLVEGLDAGTEVRLFGEVQR